MDEPLIDDSLVLEDFDPRPDLSDEEFAVYLKDKYRSEVELPDPAQTPLKPTPPLAPAAPTSADRELSQLRGQIAALDAEIAGAEPAGPLTTGNEEAERNVTQLAGTVQLRGERELLAMQERRLAEGIQFNLIGASDDDLAERAGDAAIELEDAQQALNALPVPGVRTPADNARAAKAERKRDEALRRSSAIERERITRRELAGFAKVREQSIDAMVEQAIASERQRDLNARLEKARSEPDYSPDLDGWIRTTWRREKVTDEQRAAKRAEVAQRFDASIHKGQIEQLVSKLF